MTAKQNPVDEYGVEEGLMEGVPHPPGTKTVEVEVTHPVTGETHRIHVPANHDGSRIRVGFPEVRDENGTVVAAEAYGWTEGWDPVDRAGSRPVVPCQNCGAPQVLTSESFDCSACGSRNTIELKLSSEQGSGQEQAEG